MPIHGMITCGPWMKRCNMSKQGKRAAALAFTPSRPAPVLVASGRDKAAERILAEAQKAGITIVEDSALAALLEAVEPGDYIPPWCWEAAARVLAFVFAQERENLSGGGG